MAQSLDGHIIEPDGRWRLGSREDKRRMDRLRNWADCVIASRRSIEADDPTLFVRSKPKQARQPRPVIVLSDSSRPLNSALQVFSSPHPAGEVWSKVGEAKVPTHWESFSFEKAADITDSLGRRGFRKILLEGGGSLNGFFIAEDLVDEIFFTIVPHLWGGATTDRIVSSKEVLPPKRFRLRSVERRKSEVFFRYQRRGEFD